MKYVKAIIACIILMIISVSLVWAADPIVYTNKDLERAKRITKGPSIYSNEDLTRYRLKTDIRVPKRRIRLSWKSELNNLCEQAERFEYITDYAIDELVSQSSFLRSTIEGLNIDASYKYSELIHLENCRSLLTAEKIRREQKQEVKQRDNYFLAIKRERQRLEAEQRVDPKLVGLFRDPGLKDVYEDLRYWQFVRSNALSLHFHRRLYRKGNRSFITCGHTLRAGHNVWAVPTSYYERCPKGDTDLAIEW